jgi:hypothetical protein
MNKFLFKYTTRIDFIDNGLFRFTQRNALNDPCEFYAEIVMDCDSAEDIEVARQQARDAGFSEDEFERWSPLFLEPLPKRRMTPEEFLGLTYPPGIKSMAELDKQNAEKELEGLLKHIDETYGIFCLTESNDNFLMWSHYAESHKGVAIGFDASHPFFTTGLDFHQVEYSPRRTSLTSKHGMLRLAGHFHQRSRYSDLPVRLFLRKASEWAYEKEWRMIRKLEECDHCIPGKPPIYLFKIPRETIQVLIFGERMLPEDKERISKAVAKSGDWSHLRLFEAKIPNSGFGLEIIPFEFI